MVEYTKALESLPGRKSIRPVAIAADLAGDFRFQQYLPPWHGWISDSSLHNISYFIKPRKARSGTQPIGNHAGDSKPRCQSKDEDITFLPQENMSSLFYRSRNSSFSHQDQL